MDDVLEISPGFGVSEDDRAEFFSIQGAGRITDAVAEPAKHVLEAGTRRGNSVAREHVSVDGRHAELFEAGAAKVSQAERRGAPSYAAA